MCASSAVSDYYQYPNRNPGIGNPFMPGLTPGIGVAGWPVQPSAADHETREMMRQVLKLLDKIDKKLGDVECMDESKAAFLKALDLDPANLGG